MAWFRSQWGTYVGNATAVRDFRVQMRGPRTIVIFATYLALLILVAMLMYSNVADRGSTISISQAQGELKTFYWTVMGLLGLMIFTVTPALSATSIVVERQRRSLDLVFSAPVKPKYFLVGKLIGAYRYTWMLLILSLPVTSACVVLGGAAWQDVLITYVLLSLSGLLFSAVALLVSCSRNITVVSAILLSYFACGSFVIGTTIMGGASLAMSFGSGGRGMEMSAWPALNPFTASLAAPSHSVIFGVPVLNVFLAAVFTFSACQLLMLGAGSSLAPASSPETRSLRIYGLLYGFALFFLLGWGISSGTSVFRSFGGPTAAPSTSAVAGLSLLIGSGLLSLVLPNLACYGWDAERRFRPDGIFNPKRILSARASGGLPYLLLVLTLMILGVSVGALASGEWVLDWTYARLATYTVSLWVCVWSVGRLTSSFNVGLRSARMLQFVFVLAAAALPPLVLTSFDREAKPWGVWDLYLLRTLFESPDRWQHTVTMTVLLLVGAGLMTKISETKRIAMMPPAYDEREDV
ncbi:MAG: ABC transporter permease [Fimbriimonas sp.]